MIDRQARNKDEILGQQPSIETKKYCSARPSSGGQQGLVDTSGQTRGTGLDCRSPMRIGEVDTSQPLDALFLPALA